VPNPLEIRLDALARLTELGFRGHVGAVLAVSDPGLGKSFVVNETLKRLEFEATALGLDYGRWHKTIRASVSPVMLYAAAYQHRHRHNILVLDDADHILATERGLNLLKALLDSEPKRRLSWLTLNQTLRRSGIEPECAFEGCVIFLSNVVPSARATNGPAAAHLRAIMSRVYTVDLTLASPAPRNVRGAHPTVIEFVARRALSVCERAGLTARDGAEVWAWWVAQAWAGRLREPSTRSLMLAARLANATTKWRHFAELTLASG
jgi:hypothetical protein